MNQSFKMNRFSLTTFLKKKKKGQNVSSKNYRDRLFIHFFLTNCHLPYEQPLNLRAQALYQKVNRFNERYNDKLQQKGINP